MILSERLSITKKNPLTSFFIFLDSLSVVTQVLNGRYIRLIAGRHRKAAGRIRNVSGASRPFSQAGACPDPSEVHVCHPPLVSASGRRW